MKVLTEASVSCFVFLFVVLLPAITSAGPLPPSTEVDVPKSAASTRKGEKTLTQWHLPPPLPTTIRENKPINDDKGSDKDDDPKTLKRLKRELHERDPWGRVIPRRPPHHKVSYGRRNPHHSPRRFSRRRQRIRLNQRGVGYGHDDYDAGMMPWLTNTA